MGDGATNNVAETEVAEAIEVGALLVETRSKPDGVAQRDARDRRRHCGDAGDPGVSAPERAHRERLVSDALRRLRGKPEQEGTNE